MASEYLLYKYRDVKPDVKRELTPEEKRRNWWDYHRNYVIIGVILLLCLANILWNAFGFGKVKPDFSVAYVGTTPLTPEAAEAIQNGFTAKASDMNGDGRVVVELLQYTSIDTGDSDSLYYAQAAQVQLVSDIADCRSYFFLMEDPAAFQNATSALRNLDGSLPADGDLSPDGKYLLWGACPALNEIELGDAEIFVATLAFGRRGFWNDKTTANAAACDELWNTLTKGA